MAFGISEQPSSGLTETLLAWVGTQSESSWAGDLPDLLRHSESSDGRVSWADLSSAQAYHELLVAEAPRPGNFQRLIM